jgi:hypothetical protein
MKDDPDYSAGSITLFDYCSKCGSIKNGAKCPRCDAPGIFTRAMSPALTLILLLAVIIGIMIFLHAMGE